MVNEAPEVSVIIPVYNSEKYLGECLESVLAQTLKQIEIICVDDGSQDRSLTIISEYAEKDARIQIVRQAHKGVSAARNTGIRKACGKYLYFMDSDDLLEPEALKLLYERAERDSLDITFFNGRAYTESTDFKGTVVEQNILMKRTASYSGVYSGPKMMETMYANHEYWMTVWLQLYRRDFLLTNELQFYEGIIHEDNLFSYISILSAERCGYLKDELYMKRVRPHSITTSRTSFENVYGYFICFLKMKDFLLDFSETGKYGAPEAVMFKSLAEARRVFKMLDDKEIVRYLELPYEHQVLFHTMIIDYCSDRDYNLTEKGSNSRVPVTEKEKESAAAVIAETRALPRILAGLKRLCHRILPSSRYNVAWSYQHLTAQLQVQQQLINHIISSEMRIEKNLEAFKEEMSDLS